MKKIIFLLLALVIALPASAQTVPPDSSRTRTAREWEGRLISWGGSAAVNAMLTEVLKSSIHETRPNGRDRHSWPSRHTSWAFWGAGVLTHELYRNSPWWVILSHAGADAMAIQRVASGNHFPKDVVGGAAIGLMSVEAGYMVGRAVFPGAYPALPYASADWLPGVDVTTTVFFPWTDVAHGFSARTGMMTAVRASLPLGETFGFAAQADYRALPVYGALGYVDMAHGLGLSAGVALSRNVSGRWAPTARLMAGAARNFHSRAIRPERWGFTAEAALGAACFLTPKLSVGGEVGYMCWRIRSTVSAVTLSLVTRACF